MAKLTPKQQQIYDYILAFANEHGYPPPCVRSPRPWG